MAASTSSVAPYTVAQVVDGQLIRPSRSLKLLETDDGARKIPDRSCCGTESSGPRIRCRQARAPARNMSARSVASLSGTTEATVSIPSVVILLVLAQASDGSSILSPGAAS